MSVAFSLMESFIRVPKYLRSAILIKCSTLIYLLPHMIILIFIKKD